MANLFTSYTLLLAAGRHCSWLVRVAEQDMNLITVNLSKLPNRLPCTVWFLNRL